MDTLILAECVLAYLSPESSSVLLQHLSTLLNRPFAICYEMCVAGDDPLEAAAQPSKFGTVMLNNLQVRFFTKSLQSKISQSFFSPFLYRLEV